MDSSKILALIEQLDDEIDDLEESLEPLLKAALSDTASKLPLLDKAKLYVLVTYAIESMLFSYLRLHGVKAREHPVFVELTRVRQYFDKIKTAETPAVRSLVLDKNAAHRFVRAGLVDNEKYDLQRAEREAKERAKAHIRFEELSKEINTKRKAQAIEDSPNRVGSDSSDSDSSSEHEPGAVVAKEPTPPPVKPKRKRTKKRKQLDSAPASGNSTSTPSSSSNKKNKTNAETPVPKKPRRNPRPSKAERAILKSQ